MATDTAHANAFRDRIRKLHQEAHPEAWPHLAPQIANVDPGACLNLTGLCLADRNEN